MGEEIAHGDFGNDKIAASSIASGATPNCIPSPINAPNLRSILPNSKIDHEVENDIIYSQKKEENMASRTLMKPQVNLKT